MIDSNQKKKKILIIGVAVVATIFAGIILFTDLLKDKDNGGDIKPTPTPTESNTVDFNANIIKQLGNSKKTNYLVSPYNIELALNMLRDGADGNTKLELDKVIGNRIINDIKVKDKVGVANGVFIKNEYKNNVKKDYYNILNTKYNSEVIYDEFTKPDKINNWVKEKTNGMIPKILDQMSADFVMGLASALAIDVKWASSFECTSTNSSEFTKIDDTKINVEMMHKTYEYNAKFIQSDEVDGIIIPYAKEENSNVELEFIGLLPKNGIDSFVNTLTSEKINTIISSGKEASEDIHVNLSLPRFKYDYNVDNFIDDLKSLGINDAFNPVSANFKKMAEIDGYNLYVGEAIHKTHIELNEVGTKAAAITYFGMYKSSAALPKEYEEVNISFDKPFVYVIREKNTSEVLFFGVVFEPNKWNGTTCENK